MKEKKKEEKVISKNNKGSRKKLSKKENIFKNFIKIIKEHKIITFSMVSIIIIIPITIFIINYVTYNTKIITINNVDYTKSDFSVYLFSAKYNYFNGNMDITENDLKVVYDEETNMTVADYLKEIALSDIKTAAAIKMLAEKYDVTLSDNDYEEIENEKKDFIKSLGSKKDFKKFLKNNNTNEEAYNNMSETDKLYKKLISNIFSEDKIKDLTEDEKKEANSNYQKIYFKIKQVILAIIDVNTGKSLNSTTINQKETLANKIVEETKKGTNFDELIKKYSEDSIDKDPPYEMYYKTGELLPELESAVLELKNGEVSKVIKTNYAYHIIQKQVLDDKKLNDYYDNLREEKCIDELKENINKLQIIYHDAYENIKIK